MHNLISSSFKHHEVNNGWHFHSADKQTKSESGYLPKTQSWLGADLGLEPWVAGSLALSHQPKRIDYLVHDPSSTWCHEPNSAPSSLNCPAACNPPCISLQYEGAFSPQPHP